MKNLLQQQQLQGKLQQLDIINLEQSPEIAEHYNVRSVPWLKLGEYVFDIALSPGELDFWIQHATDQSGITHYLAYLLEHGKLSVALEWLELGKSSLKDLIPLLSSPDTQLTIRIGIGAIMETYEDTSAIQAILPELVLLLQESHPMIRIDACHYLSLTHAKDAIEPLRAMLEDKDQQVREAAREGLDQLELR